MSFVVEVMVIVVAAVVGIAVAVIGVVQGAKGKWVAAGICALGVLMAVGTGGLATAWAIYRMGNAVTTTVSGVAGAVHESISAAAERDRQRRAVIQTRTPGVDWDTVDAEFWEFPGTGGWNRVPVRYPFEVHTEETADEGALFKNVAGGKSKEPAANREAVGPKAMKAYAVDGRMMPFREGDDGAEKWGVFVFETGELKRCATETDLWAEAKKLGWTGPEELSDVRAWHRAYWAW